VTSRTGGLLLKSLAPALALVAAPFNIDETNVRFTQYCSPCCLRAVNFTFSKFRRLQV